MGRRELREHIFKILFVSEFNKEEEMPQQLCLYFEGLEELSEEDQSYMQKKYNLVKEHIEEMDTFINEASTSWKTTRMSKVDLTILRLAIYEMKYDEEVPTKVAINEAVEIAKQFGGEESFSFINGILGKLSEE